MSAVALTTMFMLAGCCQEKKSESESTTVEKCNAVSLSVSEFTEQAESLVGKTIKVEGICSHVCAHGGRKIALIDTVSEALLQGLAGPTIEIFPSDVVAKSVWLEGVVEETRIDEAYLADWEKQINEGTEEKHGNDEEEGGCSTEKKLRGENAEANSSQARIDAFRTRIAERNEKEGKAYLSFFNIKVAAFDVVK